jgi:hypothetical protein
MARCAKRAEGRSPLAGDLRQRCLPPSYSPRAGSCLGGRFVCGALHPERLDARSSPTRGTALHAERLDARSSPTPGTARQRGESESGGGPGVPPSAKFDAGAPQGVAGRVRGAGPGRRGGLDRIRRNGGRARCGSRGRESRWWSSRCSRR